MKFFRALVPVLLLGFETSCGDGHHVDPPEPGRDASPSDAAAPRPFRLALGSDKASGGEDIGTSITVLAGGDLAIGGSSENTFAPQDAVVARLNASGVVWAMSYGATSPPSDERVFSLIEVEGGLLAMGRISGLRQSGLVFHVDSDGRLVWARSLAIGSGAMSCESAARAADGTIFLGCTVGQPSDAVLIKLDVGGRLLWSRKVRVDPGAEAVVRVTALRDGGCLLLGNTESYGAEMSEGLAVRFAKDGELVWSATFARPDGPETLTDAAELTGGDLLVVFSGLAPGKPQPELPVLLRLSSVGELVWAKRYDLPGAFRGITTTASGAALVGSSFIALADQSGVLRAARQVLPDTMRFQGYERITSPEGGSLAVIGTSTRPVGGDSAQRLSTGGRMEILQIGESLSDPCAKDVSFATFEEGSIRATPRTPEVSAAEVVEADYPAIFRPLQWFSSGTCI